MEPNNDDGPNGPNELGPKINVVEPKTDQMDQTKPAASSEKWTNGPTPYRGLVGPFSKPDKIIYISPFGEIDRTACQAPKWLIENVIPKLGVSFLAAAPANYKSTLALYFAVHLTAGRPIWNGKSTEPCVVWFADEEDFGGHLYQVIDRLTASFSDDEKKLVGKNLLITSQQAISLDSGSDLKLLDETLQIWKPKLVILDSLRRMTTTDENESGAISMIYKKVLAPLTDAHEVSWLVLHHKRKKEIRGRNDTSSMLDFETIRGSSDIAAISTTILMLERLKNEGEVVFGVAKNKWGSQGKCHVLRVEHGEKTIKIVDCGEVEAEYAAVSTLANKISEWLIVEGKTSVKTAEISTKFGSGGTTKRAIKLLRERKILHGEKSPYNVGYTQSKLGEDGKDDGDD